VREWCADSRQTWDGLRKARKELLNNTNGLAVMPPLYRLWHGHLFWLASFIRITARTYFSRPVHWVIRSYCRNADRLLGGDRLRRYREFHHMKAKECEAKASALEAKTRRDKQVLFEDLLQHEANQNPNFVPSKRNTIQ
jgi:hypothetical protein